MAFRDLMWLTANVPGTLDEMTRQTNESAGTSTTWMLVEPISFAHRLLPSQLDLMAERWAIVQELLEPAALRSALLATSRVIAAFDLRTLCQHQLCFGGRQAIVMLFRFQIVQPFPAVYPVAQKIAVTVAAAPQAIGLLVAFC